MKFYVNKINQSLNGLKTLKEGEYYVGLFSQCETKSEGYFAGYYACEKYVDTNLIAYLVFSGNYLSKKMSDAVIVSRKFKKIQIASHMLTKVIEASSIKEAVEKFEKSEWRQWDCEIDENKNIEI